MASSPAHTHPFNGPFSRTTQVGRYQKGKTNLDFTEARDSEWRWHQLRICKSAPRSRQNNHASTSPLSYLQAGCPSCRPTNSVKALKASSLALVCFILSYFCSFLLHFVIALQSVFSSVVGYGCCYHSFKHTAT